MVAGWRVLGLSTVLVLTGCGAPSGPAFPALSVVLVARGYQTSAEALGEVVDQALAAEPELLSTGYKTWAETEVEPGVFDWSDFDHFPPVTRQLAFDVPSPAGFSGGLDVPADLVGEPFDSPVLAERYDALLRSAIAAAPGELRYLTFHTEGVQEFFAGREPAEREAFCALMEGVMTRLHADHPALRLGAYWRYENVAFELFECLNRATDVVAVAMILNPPRDSPGTIVEVLDRYVAAADGKPLFIVEAGYPSSTGVGSSEADQAEFIDLLFDAVAERAAAIEALAVYSVFDEDETVARAIGDAVFGVDPSEPKSSFVAWLSSLGLQSDEGPTPKLAWQTFLDRAGRRRTGP